MSNSSPSRPVIVRATPIELSAFLKFAGAAQTGGGAKQAITEGEVLVNGAVETRKGRKLAEGDQVTIRGEVLVVALR